MAGPTQLAPTTENGPVPDRGPPLVILMWTLTAIASLTAFARVYFRGRYKALGWDDIFMILAMICFIGWSTVLTLYAHKGGEQHIYDLVKTGPDNVATVLFLNWLSQVFGIMGVAFGKVSVSALLLGILRMTEMKWHRMYLWSITITLAMLVAVSCSILTFAQCSPAKALWDLRVKGKCLDPKVIGDYGTFTGSFNTFADASLAIIPITIFWSLNTDTTEKIQLSIVFGLNILTAICSGVKTQYLVQLGKRQDTTWATLNIFIWVTIELFIMIVCGTIPTLHPLLKVARRLAGQVSGQVSSRSRRTGGSSKLSDEESRLDLDSLAKRNQSAGHGIDTELSRLSGRSSGVAKVTAERGDAKLRQHGDSVDRLVEEEDTEMEEDKGPGVRVKVTYDVQRSSRPLSWAG